MLATTQRRAQAEAAVGEARRRVSRLRSDFELWCRTCYRIRTKDGEVVPFVLRPNQRAIRAAEREEIARQGRARLIVLKGRQGGVTTAEQAANLHQVWKEPGFDAMTLAHTLGDTQKIFQITRRALDHFPQTLLPSMGGKETNEVSFTALDSHFWTGTAGAKRTGRGLTLKRVHGSEFAFWGDPMGILNAIGPAIRGVPNNVIVLETTASEYGSVAHEFWLKAAKGRGDPEWNGYRTLFFPWWECDPVKYRTRLFAPDELGALTPEEQALVARGLDLEQIKWRRETMIEMGRPDFLQEYAEDEESCWLAAGDLFYDADTLKYLLDRKPRPLRVELSGSLSVYGDPEGEAVIMGVDTAEGGGGDRSTWAARAYPSWRLLSVYEDRKVEPGEFARLLATQGKAYGSAFLVVEKNAHGITVLRELRDTHSYPVQSLYHRRALDQRREEASDRIGWATTAESQPLMLDAGRELLNAARAGLAGVPSGEAVRDAFRCRRDDNGKVRLNAKDVLVAEMLAWLGRGHAPKPGGAMYLPIGW